MPVPDNVLPWTADEDEKLRNLVLKGASAAKIAKLLNRSAPAVRARASRLGLSVRQVTMRKQ